MAESDNGADKGIEFTVKKGERIPRKPLGEYSEADSLGQAISRDGFLGTAMDDKNQYGPVSMMILLLIVATITGLALKLLSR
tara:strand:- start:376 stop:621 length:246 start_codon:yes stop_codon:yes gene_type:complete